ncbi:hypothetical protein B1810_07690 [Panacagrimonas perspica]|uniref:peptidoglycan-binding domain-containing protein n=1 Tax=Panacagrimonas perspica TaxID=381431 RepID=UPI00113EB024|nr:peptidoglycan-binding domain-containing protein [Panacagrimonas perspica]THD03756.1 hypothetical protein B1810_07690 [Panacagrimonas perspica]
MALKSLRFSRDQRLQKASENNPSLKRGATGEAVVAIQLALLDLGYPLPVTTNNGRKLPDGIYGAETEKAVRLFQAQALIGVDGHVGKQTLQKLEERTIALSLAQTAAGAATQNFSPQQASMHRTLR